MSASPENSQVRNMLAERGLAIPPPQVVPPGVRLTYRRLVRDGSTVYIAGHGPTLGEGWGFSGKIGVDLSIEEGVKAAELTGLNMLGTIERAREPGPRSCVAQSDGLRQCGGWLHGPSTSHKWLFGLGAGPLRPRQAGRPDLHRGTRPAVQHASRDRRGLGLVVVPRYEMSPKRRKHYVRTSSCARRRHARAGC